MKPSSLVTAVAALLFATQAHAMSWIPQPMYGTPANYPPAMTQQYPAPYPIVGGDRDPYGCIPSAGYQWCEFSQKCIRPWEESCSRSTAYTPVYPQSRFTPTINEPCDRASGFVWCAAKQTCIRPWTEDCAFPSTSRYYPTKDNTISDEHGCIAAQGFYWCEAQSACLRTGTACTSRYPIDSTIGCSSVQPWDSYGCNALRGETWCDSKQSCIRHESETCPNDPSLRNQRCATRYGTSTVTLPPADRDENGCRRDYGYKWCSSLDKCYRPWEERCPEPSANPYRKSCTETARSHICVGSPGFEWCDAKNACVRIGTKCK